MSLEMRPFLVVLAAWPLPEEPSWIGRHSLPAGDGTGRVALQIMLTTDERDALMQAAEGVWPWDGGAIFNAKARFPDIQWDALGYLWGYEP